MKEQLKLTVSNPCQENWNSFTQTEKGGFCSNCQKEVIDFTQFSDQQLITYFKEQQGNTCGKFSPRQLNRYHELVPIVSPKMGLKQFKMALAACVLFLISKPAISLPNQPSSAAPMITQHQSREPIQAPDNNDPIKVSGKVVDEYGEVLPAVSVILKGSDKGTSTDIDGKFVFPEPLQKGDVLIFSFIGMERKEYKIKDESEVAINIVLEMDVMVLGEVSVEGSALTANKAPKPTLFQRIASWF